MSFFSEYLKEKNLNKHDGRPLWEYNLNKESFNKLLKEIILSGKTIDERDVALYYAEWWKNIYNGGIPSKQEIYNSLGKELGFFLDSEEFYKLAKKGGQILGFKWVTKQKTLYFRTLLLQGGLPINHISKNPGIYLNFLLAVLEEQPDTIEDFIFNTKITNILPNSARNEAIYENCLAIVKSILNDENIFDHLLDSDENLKNISRKLKVKKKELEKKPRLSKPKNHWLLDFNIENPKIYLKIGLADYYNEDSLENILRIRPIAKEYKFFLNDNLLCIFKKMINGNYKTSWFNKEIIDWKEDNIIPNSHVFAEGERFEVNDFIENIPNLKEPSLWMNISENECSLVRGNRSSGKEAALLLPIEWNSNENSKEINIYGKKLFWLPFEGEIDVFNSNYKRKYLSGVKSFEWTIICQKPKWLLKGNIPVSKYPEIVLFDENNIRISPSKYKCWLRRYNSDENWTNLSGLNKLPEGCIELKIQKDDIIVYDVFFNTGALEIIFLEQSLSFATVQINNINNFEINFNETDLLKISNENNIFKMKLDSEGTFIPLSVSGSIGLKNQRKLLFQITSPFEGISITDEKGKLINKGENLKLSNLYGLRILSKSSESILLKINNSLKKDVVIIKEIENKLQPLITYRDEINRLLFLADVMEHKNKVSLSLIDDKKSITYYILKFSHTLNVTEQFKNEFTLHESSDLLNLYAIPINCSDNNIELIPLVLNENIYRIPEVNFTKQFILISINEEDKQLMPRFVNLDENYIGLEKEERIIAYHNQLVDTKYDNQIWKQMMAYFKICLDNGIPFSTFDQLRAISRSSKAAAKAFFSLINQENVDFFIKEIIPELEKDLGFCFHWCCIKDWSDALFEADNFYRTYYSSIGSVEENYLQNLIEILNLYLNENGLNEIMNNGKNKNEQFGRIGNQEFNQIRSQLGSRVLKELPTQFPKITQDYGIPLENHKPIKLLIYSAIAIAEEITGKTKDFSIWENSEMNEIVRRNIQYSQYLNPDFYRKVILQVLTKN